MRRKYMQKAQNQSSTEPPKEQKTKDEQSPSMQSQQPKPEQDPQTTPVKQPKNEAVSQVEESPSYTPQKVDPSGQAFNDKLEELTRLSKTTQLDYYFEQTYCDIKDPNTNQWKTGKVLERDDEEVKVRFYYNNIVKTVFTLNVSSANDKDISLFRLHTSEENYYFNNAYQKIRENAITNSLIFEAKAALKLLNSMADFSNAEFANAFESPLEVVQEIRGKLYYIFLDVLNNNFNFEYEEQKKSVQRRKNPKRAAKEEEEENFDVENDILISDVGYLINDYLNFSIKYLQWINAHSEIGRLLTFNYSFMLFDKECAFFSSLFEFASILSMFFRENKMFLCYRDAMAQCLKEEFGLEKVDYKISTAIYKIAKEKGIDDILKGILVNENQSLFVFEQMAKILSSNSLILFDDRDRIYDFYFNRVNNLTMNEQKFISFEDVENYCDKIRTLIDAITIDNREERNVDRIHLHFVYKLILSDNLPLKIRGIALFSKLIKEEEISHKHITYFIQQVHLISKVILGPDIHEEILKRSINIFIYVLKDKEVNNSRAVQTLFKELTNKNKSISVEIKKILMNITAYFNEDLQNYFFEEVLSKTKYENYFVDLVDILRNFCINTKNNKILEIFWNVLSVNTNFDVIDCVINSLRTIFETKIFSKDIILQYLLQSFDEIEKNDSIQYMKLFVTIIDVYLEELKNDIFSLDERKNVLKIFQENLLAYIRKGEDDDKSLKDNKLIYRKEDNLSVRFDLIVFMYGILNNFVYDNNFQGTLNTLWKIIVNEPTSSDLDKNIFFKFLVQSKDIIEKNKVVREHLYYKLMLDDIKNPPHQIVYNEIFLFNKLLYKINADKFLFINSSVRVANPNEVDGFDFLWKILKVSEIENVRKSVCSMLTSMCLNPISFKDKKANEEIWEDYYNRIYKMIKKHRDNDAITINNIVFLLQNLENNLKKDNTFVVPNLFKPSELCIKIPFYFTNQNILKQIDVDLDKDTIYDLKEKASFHFQVPIKLIDLKLRNELMPIPYEDDDKLFNTFINLNINANVEIEVYEGTNKLLRHEKNPKKILLENENIFNELLHYLGQYNKYNKTDQINYYLVNQVIYSYPPGKQLLDDITTFKIWEKLKNDSSIYSKNYLIKIIKSKIADEKWLELLKKENKMERLFFNILSTFELTKKARTDAEKNQLNEIEFLCLENLLYITDKTEDVKGANAYSNMYNKCIELLYEIVSNDKVENGPALDALFSFMSNNKTEKTAALIIKNKNDYIKKICTDCLLQTSKINNKNKNKLIDFFIKNDFGDEAFLGMFNYMLDTELLHKIITDSEGNQKTDDDSFFAAILAFIRKANLNEETLKRQRKFIMFDLNEIVELIIKYINNYTDTNGNEIIMIGFLKILKEIMLQNENILYNLKKDSQFFKFIFEKSLFKDNICVDNKEMMKTIFYILNLLIINNKDNTQKVLSELNKSHELSFWRSNSFSDWSLVPSPGKNKLSAVGLVNLGHTCYMNSLLQQIYANKFLREKIISDCNPKLNGNKIFQELKQLLTQMKFSYSNLVNPKPFFEAILNFDNKKLNPKEQMDVDEFFNLLLSKLELCEGLKDAFQGTLVNTYTCTECNHRSIVKEDFHTLSLPIKNQKTLTNSLNNFFEGEILDGENRYFCEKCQRKVRAEKTVGLKELPNTLMIVLKKFNFDYDKNLHMKIYDYFQVQKELNVTSFYEGVEVDKSLEYKLSGAILHRGNADFGHFYSLVKNSEDKWIECNDKDVYEYDLKYMDEDLNGDVNSKENDLPSAYILFYQRVGTESKMQETIKDVKDIKEQQLSEFIVYENNKSQVSRIFFTSEYKNFLQDFIINYNTENIKNVYSRPFITKNINYDVYKLKREVEDVNNSNIDKLLSKFKLLQINKMKNVKAYNDNFEIFKFYAKYFLFIYIRLKDSTQIEEGMDIFKSLLNSNIENCVWLINNFSNIKVIEEFLVKNPIHEVKFFVLGLVYCALINLNRATREENSRENYEKIILNFVNICIEVIIRKLEDYENYDLSPIYTMLVRFVSFGEKSYEYFETINIVNIIEVFFYKRHTKGSSKEIIKTEKYGEINEADLYYFPKIDYTEFVKDNELLVPQGVKLQSNYVAYPQEKEDCSPFIVLLCKMILNKREYMSVFKASDYSFCSSLLLESNNRICIAHLINIFRQNIDDVEIVNIVYQSIIPLLKNIIEISEDSQINYLIYLFNYFCSFIDPGENNNKLFMVIKQYFQIIKDQSKYYLFTYFNIKNVVYLFNKYFQDKSDLIGQLENDFRTFIKWLNDHPYPPKYYPGNTFLYKTYDYDYSRVKIGNMQYQMFMLEYKKKVNEVKENLIKILNGKFKQIVEDEELEIFTDGNDYTNFKFSKDDLIKVNLKEGRVKKVLDEMILVEYKDKDPKKCYENWSWTNTSLRIVKLNKKDKEETNN